MAAHEVPPSVVIGQGAVWVANKLDNSLSRIDPQTNRVVATTAADDGVADLAAGRDAVWTGGDRRGVARVVRIASRTNRVVATVPVTYQPAGLAVTDDAVWVTSFVGGTLWRIDPQTNSATSIRMAGKPNAIAVGADAAWVKNSDRRTVQRIDPRPMRSWPRCRSPRACTAWRSTGSRCGAWTASATRSTEHDYLSSAGRRLPAACLCPADLT